MRKLFRKKLFRKKGFSLLGSLIGFSFLGVSTVGLATYMGNFEQVQVQYSEQSEVSFQHKSLIETVRSMIVGVQADHNAPPQNNNNNNNVNYKVHGLCKLVGGVLQYNALGGKFLCPIKIPKNQVTTNAVGFSSSRWEYFLKVISSDHWKLALGECTNSKGFIGGFTEGSFNKCVKSEGAGGKTLLARIKVVPKNIVTNKNIEPSTDTILVDRLGYKIETVISIPTEITQDGTTQTNYSLTKGEKLVLSSEVLECHICKTGTCDGNNLVVARLSTSSIAIASADTTVGGVKVSDICYHADSSFEKDICNEDGEESVLSLDYVKKNILQAGGIIPPTNDDDGDDSPTHKVVTSDTAENVALSCSTHVFKCKGDAHKFENEDDFDPSLRMTYGLYLDTVVTSSNIDSIDFKISGTDRDGDEHSWTLPALHDAGDGRARVGRSDSGLQNFDKDRWPLKSGATEITTYASIKSGSVNACNQICTPGGTYSPSINLKFNSKSNGGDRACTQEIDFKDRDIKAQCTVCYMKNCHRYGLGTFGKAARQPIEPSDGSVPECVLNNIYSSGTPLVNNVTGSDDLTKECMVKTSSGLKAVDCGEARGVLHTASNYQYKASDDSDSSDQKTLCFVNGKSKIISGPNKELNTSLNCLAPLKEAQMLGTDINGVWTNGLLPSLSLAYNLPPAGSAARTVKKVLTAGGLAEVDKDSKKVFEIKNSANMATYFSDPLDSTVEISTGDEVWVNVQRDASGAFHGGWPAMIKGGDWSFFYREPFDGTRFNDVDDVPAADLPSGETANSIKRRSRPARPIFVKMAGFGIDGHYSNETKTGTAIKALQLVHHLKYKGLRGVDQTTGRDFPYLCRDILPKGGHAGSKFKDLIKVSTQKGNSLSSGQAACQNLGDEWYFIPPDSRELWAAALQAVAPNAARYSFPNPFKFADGVPFHSSSGKLSFSLAEFPSIEFNLSKNSDHHMVVDKSLLKTPDAAWVNLVPAHGVTNPDIYKVSDWSPSWDAVFGSEIKSNSIFKHPFLTEQFNKLTESMSPKTDKTIAGDQLAGLIDKAGNMLTIAEFRDYMESDGVTGDSVDVNNWARFRKICRVRKSYKDIWKHLMPRSFLPKIPCTVNGVARGLLTAKGTEEMVKGIRPASLFAQLHHINALLPFNGGKYCDVWKAEKKRRHAGYCTAKAYNSSTNSKALKVVGSNVRHSMAITLASRGAICHNSTNGCGGAYNFYRDHTQNTNNSPIARWLNGKSSATVKAACTAAITDKAVHAQTFDPGVSGVPSFTYNFDNTPDSRCWSIEKLNPYVEIVYINTFIDNPIGYNRDNTARRTPRIDRLYITSTDTVKNSFAWNKKITSSDTSRLGLLDEDAFPDLPILLCGQDMDGVDSNKHWQSDSQTPRPHSSPNDCKVKIAPSE